MTDEICCGSSFGEQALALGDEAPGQKFLAHGLILGRVQQHLKRDAVEVGVVAGENQIVRLLDALHHGRIGAILATGARRVLGVVVQRVHHLQ